jgi:hypothetical protein
VAEQASGVVAEQIDVGDAVDVGHRGAVGVVDAHRERLEVEHRSGVPAGQHLGRLTCEPGTDRPTITVPLVSEPEGLGVERWGGRHRARVATTPKRRSERRALRHRAPRRMAVTLTRHDQWARNRARGVPPVGGEGFGSDSEADRTGLAPGSLFDTLSDPTRSSRRSVPKARRKRIR